MPDDGMPDHLAFFSALVPPILPVSGSGSSYGPWQSEQSRYICWIIAFDAPCQRWFCFAVGVAPGCSSLGMPDLIGARAAQASGDAGSFVAMSELFSGARAVKISVRLAGGSWFC